MQQEDFVLIGYAQNTAENKHAITRDITRDITRHIQIDGIPFKLCPPVLPRPRLADHPNHWLVKTNAHDIVNEHVGKTFTINPTLDKLITMLGEKGWCFWLLHDYVMKEIYHVESEHPMDHPTDF
jgi:hypothetical protein